MTPAQKAERARKRAIVRLSGTMSIEEIGRVTGYDEDEIIDVLSSAGRQQARIVGYNFQTGSTINGYTPRGVYTKAQILGWGALGADWDFFPFASKLPQSVQDIADVIGREKALLLIGKLPEAKGRRWRRVLYVPKSLDCKTGDDLIAMVGRADAAKLCQHFAGAVLQPANCGFILREWRSRQALRMAACGACSSEIAETVGMSRYRVREIIREAAGKAPEEAEI